MSKRKRDAALDSRREDGFYAHVLASCPREVLCKPTGGGNVLHVAEHGPWRVLWMDRSEAADVMEVDFFQGVTYHDAGGALVPLVVGFDYQRTMVAAALPFLIGAATRNGAPDVAVMAPRPACCLIGLGAGSCAAALSALSAGRFSVSAVEIEPAIAHAAATVHGVPIQIAAAPAADTAGGKAARDGKSGGGGKSGKAAAAGGGGKAGGKRAAAERVHVSLADAAVHMRSVPAGSLHCVLLDAYDRKGRVPSQLQAAPFVADVYRALAPGGAVLANVWRCDKAERTASDAFARRLRSAIGHVFSLEINPPREGNLLLVAVKAGGDDEAPPTLDGLRGRLRQAAKLEARAKADGAEREGLAELVACLRSNAESLRLWDGA